MYKVTMSPTAKRQSDEPVSRTQRPSGPGRARFRLCCAGLMVTALLGTSVLAAGCGSGSSGPGVARVGTTTTTTTEPSAVPSGSKANPAISALAYVSCMRTHGEPNMPEPTIKGRSANIVVGSGSGVDPNSPQFRAANNACKHLLPNEGVPSGGPTISLADRADYLKGAACMRSHGFPQFPDPVFENNTVTFPYNSRSPIDTNSPQYKEAVTICEKLIPAGLPYSSPSTS